MSIIVGRIFSTDVAFLPLLDSRKEKYRFKASTPKTAFFVNIFVYISAKFPEDNRAKPRRLRILGAPHEAILTAL